MKGLEGLSVKAWERQKAMRVSGFFTFSKNLLKCWGVEPYYLLYTLELGALPRFLTNYTLSDSFCVHASRPLCPLEGQGAAVCLRTVPCNLPLAGCRVGRPRPRRASPGSRARLPTEGLERDVFRAGD